MGFAAVKRKDADEPEAGDNAAEELAENDAGTTQDAFAKERAARAAQYLSTGAGVNQGDQNKEAAQGLERAARKSQGGRWRPNEEELDMRDTARRLRGGGYGN